MKDEDLESLLRIYEPSAPSSSLRARIVSAGGGDRRVWPWAVAAAAMVALTVGFQLSAARLLVDTAAAVQPDVSTEEIDALTALLGDAGGTRDEARQLIEQRDLEHALEDASAPIGTMGIVR